MHNLNLLHLAISIGIPDSKLAIVLLCACCSKRLAGRRQRRDLLACRSVARDFAWAASPLNACAEERAPASTHLLDASLWRLF
jgi:hypothetical protein